MDVPAMFSELNDAGFTDISTTRKVSMLNDAMWDAASRTPWPFLETVLNLTFNGSSAVPTNMPTNFQGAIDLVDTSNQNQKLVPVRVDDLDARGTDYTVVGSPTQYYFVGTNVYLYPIPSASAVVRMRYFRTPAALTDTTVEASIDWPIRHHRAIVLGALYRLYDLDDDPELSARFQSHFENKLMQMLADASMRQYDLADVVHIDPSFDIDLYD